MNPLTSNSFHRTARFLLHRRRAGKIARLPQPIREQIDLMLRDGLTYAQIIAKLGPDAKHLNKDNLSRWRKAQHQDWLAHQSSLEAGGRPAHASPEVNNIAFLLHEFDSDTLRHRASHGPHAFNRIFNLSARLLNAFAKNGKSTPAPPSGAAPPTNNAC
ncbi:MAG TPA: hypothetical protein VG146_11105 [Verrucomicrobiae bacterium]|nr:hypothetical protein [Verrucomicrobiae bacterium]